MSESKKQLLLRGAQDGGAALALLAAGTLLAGSVPVGLGLASAYSLGSARALYDLWKQAKADAASA
jgi:hypothetical protein